MFGRVLDTFVMTQLRPELALHALRPRAYYFRDPHRREADIVIELASGILAVEVRAGAGPDRRAARHLEWLRDQLGASSWRSGAAHRATCLPARQAHPGPAALYVVGLAAHLQAPRLKLDLGRSWLGCWRCACSQRVSLPLPTSPW